MTISYNKSRSSVRAAGLSSNKKSKFITSLLIPVFSIIMMTGCEEDPSKIGSGILPGSDFNSIAASDTFTVNSYTSYFDKIISFWVDSNNVAYQPEYSYLGSLYDPYFGLTNAGFVSQLWLYSEWPRNHETLDSMILYLHFSDLLGGLPAGQVVNIWEIDEFLTGDSVYYSSHDVPKKQLLASFTLDGLPDTDTVMSFHMPQLFMDELFRDTTMIFLANDSVDFRNYFNGLYFEYPQSGDYHMAKVNLNGGYSSLRLHYTDTAGTNSSFTFLFNSKTVYFNTFEHDFDAAEPGKKIQYLNQELKDTISYIQGFNGAFTTVVFPGLEQLKDKMPIGINKARLYLPAFFNETDFPEEALPIKLIARYADEDDNRYVINDYFISTYFIDGQYYSLDDYYVLNITTFVQDYLEGAFEDPRLEIVLEEYEGNNLILWANNSDNHPKLEIVFTEQ